MDEAAFEAKTELLDEFDNWTAADVAAWWERHFRAAGHRRLGRALVDVAKKKS